MNAYEILSFQQSPLDKLVADHASLKKALGPNHILVQAMWSEIKKRQPNAQDTAVDIESSNK